MTEPRSLSTAAACKQKRQSWKLYAGKSFSRRIFYIFFMNSGFWLENTPPRKKNGVIFLLIYYYCCFSNYLSICKLFVLSGYRYRRKVHTCLPYCLLSPKINVKLPNTAAVTLFSIFQLSLVRVSRKFMRFPAHPAQCCQWAWAELVESKRNFTIIILEETNPKYCDLRL